MKIKKSDIQALKPHLCGVIYVPSLAKDVTVIRHSFTNWKQIFEEVKANRREMDMDKLMEAEKSLGLTFD